MVNTRGVKGCRTQGRRLGKPPPFGAAPTVGVKRVLEKKTWLWHLAVNGLQNKGGVILRCVAGVFFLVVAMPGLPSAKKKDRRAEKSWSFGVQAGERNRLDGKKRTGA